MKLGVAIVPVVTLIPWVWEIATRWLEVTVAYRESSFESNLYEPP